MRTSTVGARGNASAPPGTTDWTIAIRREICLLLDRHDCDYKRLQSLIAAVRENEAWLALTNKDGAPFTSFESFCATPEPYGLGYRLADIDAIIAERKDAAKRAKEAKPLKANGEAGNGRSSLDNIKATDGGTSAEYLTARIARDNPEILERMKAGEFPSVRAAALEAGIVQKRVSVPIDVTKAASAIQKHFTPEEVAQIFEIIGQTPEVTT
jgi:hypothetical protein